MENKHTKGEWFANNCTVTIQGTYKDIALCYSEGEQAAKSIEEMQANAKLIAASPVMYNYILKKSKEGDVEAINILNSITNG